MSWFKPMGIAYVPTSIAGAVITLLAGAFCAQVFLFIDARSHSNTDTLYGVFPYWVPTFLLWAWIAEKTSKR